MAKRGRKMSKPQVKRAHKIARKIAPKVRRRGVNPWALANAIVRGTVKRRGRKKSRRK